VTTFAADPVMLKALWTMLAVDGEFMRVSWSPGDGADVDLPAPVSEEEAVQRLVAEFDAEELLPGRLPVDPDVVVPGPRLVSYDFAVGDRAGWLRMVQRMSEDRDVLLSAGSRRRRGFGTCASASVLWARCEGKPAMAALLRFRPSPTLVLQEGATTRRTALWALRRPLGYEYLLRANKRIAHALWVPKKHAAPEFVFAAPGSCLRVGRSRPVPVRVEWFDPAALFAAREVVGQLREAPNPNAWRGEIAA
jgi:hypothetical protein